MSDDGTDEAKLELERLIREVEAHALLPVASLEPDDPYRDIDHGTYVAALKKMVAFLGTDAAPGRPFKPASPSDMVRFSDVEAANALLAATAGCEGVLVKHTASCACCRADVAYARTAYALWVFPSLWPPILAPHARAMDLSSHWKLEAYLGRLAEHAGVAGGHEEQVRILRAAFDGSGA